MNEKNGQTAISSPSIKGVSAANAQRDIHGADIHSANIHSAKIHTAGPHNTVHKFTPAKVIARIDSSVTSTQRVHRDHLPATVANQYPDRDPGPLNYQHNRFQTHENQNGYESSDPIKEGTASESEKRLARYFMKLSAICVFTSVVATLAVSGFLQSSSSSSSKHDDIIETAPIWSESIDEMLAYHRNSTKLPPLRPLSQEKVEAVTPKGNLDFTKKLPAPVSFGESKVTLASQTSPIDSSGDIKEGLLKEITQKVYSIVSKYPSKLSAIKLTSLIVSESIRAEFDPLLVAAVIRTESAFDHTAVSNVGARGLMQIMPPTKEFIENFEAIPPGERKDLFTPRYNVKLGIAYLKYLRDLYKGNMSLALMAYNWGPGNLSDAIKGRYSKSKVPHSVLRYAMRILDDHSSWQATIVANVLYR